MAKLFIPPTTHTPADLIRESLDRAEQRVTNLRGADSQALELLHLLDRTAQELAELEAAGVDVRSERVRFETIQRQLCRQQRRFVAEVGVALREERVSVQPDQTRWWWFLDEAVARQRRRQLRRRLVRGLVATVLLLVAYLAYDRFLAPPPHVRQAFRHSASGESLVEEGDLRAALAEFEAAAALTPDDPDPWLWQGVIHFELNQLDDAQVAFDTARALYETDSNFLLARGVAYLRVGDPAAANADAEQSIVENPHSGWGYYLRASVAVQQGNYENAIADLEQAGTLARAAGDVQLDAQARTQRAYVIQLQMSR